MTGIDSLAYLVIKNLQVLFSYLKDAITGRKHYSNPYLEDPKAIELTSFVSEK